MEKGETGGSYSTHCYCEKFIQNFQSLNLKRNITRETNMKEIAYENVVWFQLAQDVVQ